MNPAIIIKILGAINTVIPSIVEIIDHYQRLMDKENIEVGDKEQMKANLEKLKLPPWDLL